VENVHDKYYYPMNPTYIQLYRNSKRHTRRTRSRSRILQGNPQKTAIVTRVYKMTPRKPNSATRRVVRALIKYKKTKKSRGQKKI
jgi:ribosomal protein S12